MDLGFRVGGFGLKLASRQEKMEHEMHSCLVWGLGRKMQSWLQQMVWLFTSCTLCKHAKCRHARTMPRKILSRGHSATYYRTDPPKLGSFRSAVKKGIHLVI